MTVVVMSRDAAMRYCSEYHNKPANYDFNF